MAQWLGSAMHGVVLRTSVRLHIFVVIALHSKNRLHTEHGIQIGILTAGLLTTSPTRIAEDVHIGTPERELGVAWIIALTHAHIEDVVVAAVPVGASLIRDL